MNLKSFLGILLFSSSILTTEAQSPVSVDSFAWLTGVWELMPAEPVPGERVFEEWSLLNDNTLLGKSFSVNQRYTDIPPDTLVSENLVLSLEDNDVYYTPTVYGQNGDEPIPFKMEASVGTPGSYTFKNDEHDFPKQIIYRTVGKDSLVVSLSGTTEGTEMEQEFHYKKRETYIGDLKQYFFVMLTKGANREQDAATAAEIQAGHLANIQRLSEAGVLKLAGPFLEDGDWRGVFVFNCVTKEEVEAHLQSDPAVQAGRLSYSILPWATGINVFR